jgi:RNA polymerase sigma-70 factor (ECF subfamily)
MTRRSIGFGPDGDDLVQEVFLCVFRRVHTLRDPLALRSFVSAVAARTLSHERRQRRARFFEATEQEMRAAEALRVNADPAAKHAFCSLKQLLNRLRQRERDAFVLRFVEGMNAEEVAARLRVSTSTARRSFVHAWQQLSIWAARDPFLADYLGRASS